MPSGREKAKEHVAKLKAYLTSVDAVPARGGKPHVTAIAEACGFDRGVLYQNPAAKKMLEQAVEEKGLRGIQQTANKTDASKIQLEREVTSLQQTNSALTAEVYELRKKLKKYRHIEEMMEQGKRVIG